MKKTPLVIVSAPSGAGKSSFCRRAVEEFSILSEAVSYTTRAMRPGEQEGDPYHHVTKEEFLRLRSEDYFIEWAEVYGNFYGTPKVQVEQAKNDGKVLITDVDVQGAFSFKKLYPQGTYIFILPPSVDELRRRLEKRDQGKTGNLEQRLQAAHKEIQLAVEFDFQIVNDDFDKAFAQFKKIIEDVIKNV